MTKKSRRQRLVPHRRTSSASSRSGSIRLGLVLTVLVGVNLYVFLWRGGTSIPEVRQAAMAAEGPIAAGDGDLDDETVDPSKPVPEADEAADEQVSAWIEGEVGKGDSLGRILRRHGFDPQQTDEVVRALQPHMDFRSIRVGQTYRLQARDGAVAEFEFNLSRVEKVSAVRGTDGALAGNKVEAETRMDVLPAGGTIQSSLYGAIKASGEDTRLVAMLVDIFAYDLDFYNDQHPGDSFRMLVEKEYLKDDFLRYHKVQAAEYAGKAGTFRVFHWASDDGKVKGYFNDKGESVAKTFLKTPLKYSRVSSKFNRNRMHPVLHKRRAHLGVDYAAATGTPVWAAAAGRIVSRGYAGGAGNRVEIDHGNGYRTIYMHLSRFRKGQSVGSRIDQKTVIGYVGATGLATGAHLHFSVKKNGSYVDPLKIKMTRNAGVPKAYRAAFQRDVAVLSERLAAVPTAPKSAEIDDGEGTDSEGDDADADGAEDSEN